MASNAYKATMELVSKYKLGFLQNPGGGAFTNHPANFRCQVHLESDEDDYRTLLAAVQRHPWPSDERAKA